MTYPIPDQPPKRPTRWPLYLLIGLIAVLVLFMGACFGFAKLTSGLQNVRASGSEVGAAVFAQVQRGEYDAMYDAASPLFRQATSREQFLALMQAMDTTLGKPTSWELAGYNVRKFAGTGQPPTTVTLTFRVVHERAKSTVTLTVDGDNRLLGIHFNMGS